MKKYLPAVLLMPFIIVLAQHPLYSFSVVGLTIIILSCLLAFKIYLDEKESPGLKKRRQESAATV